MHEINDILSQVKIGASQSKQNLTVAPLTIDKEIEPEYKTLDQALAAGEVSVTEISEGGSVPELRLRNASDQAVLLLDGEELVGAKQNRVLNLTMLAPPKCELVIPVSCVEEGRWQHTSSEFSTEGRTLYAAGRAKKASQVTDSLRNVGERRASQHEVWNDLSMKFRRMGSESRTESMSDLYESYEERASGYQISLRDAGKAIGAVFLINGAIRGMELFDSAKTFHELYPKLNRSYALDAIDDAIYDGIDKESQEDDAESMTVDGFLEAIRSAEGTSHLAIGEGEDIRISGHELAGGALVARDRLIHLCAFRLRGQRQGFDQDGSMRRSSHRMRLYARRGSGPNTVH